MAIIALEGARFHAPHGFYPEEEVLGNEFMIDVYVFADITEAAEDDDLFKTVNYETLYRLCQAEMREPAQLLERVAQRIVNRIENQFDNVKGVKLKLRKIHPPLGGQVESASVQIVTGLFDLPPLNILRHLKNLADGLDGL